MVGPLRPRRRWHRPKPRSPPPHQSACPARSWARSMVISRQVRHSGSTHRAAGHELLLRPEETGCQGRPALPSSLYEISRADPFIGPEEIGTFGYSSLKFSVGDYNIIGGSLPWSTRINLFPTGMGPDGIFFTEDDPLGPIPAGWSVASLDSDPFTVERKPTENHLHHRRR